MANEMEEEFYQLRFPCRSTRLARIGNSPGAAKTAGWPVDVPCGIVQSTREPPPAAADAMDFRPRADPQPSVTPACPTSASDAQMPGLRRTAGRSDKRGCEGRLRSSMCSKLLSIPPPKAGNFFFVGNVPHRTSPGQPTVFAAPAPSPIRVRALNRNRNRNRKYPSSNSLEALCSNM
jgi:hypothetical protein